MDLLLLITYDIKDDKGRNKIAAMLLQYGFERLQYSVFAGTCTVAQWKRWHLKLIKLFNRICEKEDKLYAIPQSQKLFAKTQMTGQEFDIDWISGKVQVLYY